MNMNRPLNWLKNKLRKTKEYLNEIFLQKYLQISYKNALHDLLLSVSAIERSVLGGNVN